MARQFRLYWSNIEQYEECPQKFLWRHGFGMLDVGGGPGRPKPPPVKESRHNAVMGLVIGKVVEELYNDELWREPTKLAKILTERVAKEFKFALSENHIDWGVSPSREVLEKTCLDGVLGYLKTMRANKLLGPYAKAEVDLAGWLDNYTPIGGRPDIIIRREDTGTGIFDGKNAAVPGRYVDSRQLKWYGLCFYLAYNVLPNKLGYIYFRFPDGSPPEKYGDPPEPYVSDKPWTGVVEVPFVKDDLREIAEEGKRVFKAIKSENFDPTPSAKSCKYCIYESVCDARIEHKAKHARKKSLPVVGSVEDLIEKSTDGFVDLGFGGVTKP